ncbi:radical SAM family heme chaperone HemW [Treponema sp.]|uniref:radical SAM family heme chaperone HemW n=1 Tax=Treponema sp. TaxID=166 RepID=UPI0025D2A7D7|nr:radical SAM family heme chaperone HemW [Treponema sp.]MCR5218109.1 radical SAM family heme chaperone HemW [Treponema sp.]
MKDALLYIHIPFCLAKCDYCDFFSIPSSQKTVDSPYIDALIKEVSFWKKKFSLNSWKTLYIGGGTPSLMSPLLTEKLLTSILKASSSLPQEITIEVNPETLTKEKLLCYRQLGINRISMGVQSLNDGALKACGRHCTSSHIHNALNLLDKYWQSSLNLDLIAGLEGQSDQEFAQSAEETASFGSDHMSLYTLTLEEETPMYKNTHQGRDFDYDRADSQWFTGREILEKHGLEQYEVSNFAKKGRESIHNMGYWTQQDYAGAGCSACGTFYDGGGLRWTVKRNIEDYIKYWHDYDESKDMDFKLPSVCDSEILDKETVEFEYLMMGLRTVFGLSEKEYLKRFADLSPWHGNLKERLAQVKDIKVREQKGDRYFYLDKDGLLFLNSVLETLMN